MEPTDHDPPLQAFQPPLAELLAGTAFLILLLLITQAFDSRPLISLERLEKEGSSLSESIKVRSDQEIAVKAIFIEGSFNHYFQDAPTGTQLTVPVHGLRPDRRHKIRLGVEDRTGSFHYTDEVVIETPKLPLDLPQLVPRLTLASREQGFLLVTLAPASGQDESYAVIVNSLGSVVWYQRFDFAVRRVKMTSSGGLLGLLESGEIFEQELSGAGRRFYRGTASRLGQANSDISVDTGRFFGDFTVDESRALVWAFSGQEGIERITAFDRSGLVKYEFSLAPILNDETPTDAASLAFNSLHSRLLLGLASLNIAAGFEIATQSPIWIYSSSELHWARATTLNSDAGPPQFPTSLSWAEDGALLMADRAGMGAYRIDLQGKEAQAVWRWSPGPEGAPPFHDIVELPRSHQIQVTGPTRIVEVTRDAEASLSMDLELQSAGTPYVIKHCQRITSLYGARVQSF